MTIKCKQQWWGGNVRR